MERMDLYDAQRRPLGRTAERGEKLPEGIYHLMAHILVFHPDGRILIQRRQPFKKYWSGLWDITTGGGALAGEDTARAAMREAREELGLEVELTGRRPAFTINQGRTFDDYFLVEQAVDLSSLRLQPSEVAEVAWATAEEILQVIQEKRFVPLQEGYVRFVFGLRQGGILLPESEWPR